MKTAYVVVEGPDDVLILRSVLDPRLLENVEIVPAGARTSIPSLARSLLLRRGVPVAVFMDADAVKDSAVAERRAQVRELVSAVAGGAPSIVVLAEPEATAVFFHAPRLIRSMFGDVPPEYLAFGRRDPQGVLDHLATKTGRRWDVDAAIRSMSEQDVADIRQAPAIRDLSTFLDQAQQRVASVGA